MNVHNIFLETILMLLFAHTLSHPLPNEIQSETESLHESYRPRHGSKFPQNKNIKRKVKRSLFYGAPHKKECAIMYKNHKPVGILEPYQEKYKLIPLKEEGVLVDITPINKRKKSISDQDYDSDISQGSYDEESQRELAGFFSDQRYPYIFAKFKIDSRMEKALPEWHAKRREMQKRESDVQNAISNIQTKQMADLQIKTILDDLGLIGDQLKIDKRDAAAEDENMEAGVNKLKLTKLDEYEAPLIEKNHNEKTITEAKVPEKGNKQPESKRQISSEQNILSEGINLLENNEEDSANYEKGTISEERKKRDQLEQKLEEQIRQRLQKIKEEVKREIEQMKGKNNENTNLQSKPENEQIRRKKRNIVNTLTEEESFEINPLFNEESSLKSHIRRKRSLVSPKLKNGFLNRNCKAKNNDVTVKNSVILRSLKQINEENQREEIRNEKDENLSEKSSKQNFKSCKCNNDKNCKCEPSDEAEEKTPKKLKSCPCDKIDTNGNCQCGLVNRNVVDGNDYYSVDESDLVGRSKYQRSAFNKEPSEKQKRSPKLTQSEHHKKALADGKYRLDLHPDVYRITADFQGDIQKRESFNKIAGINGENSKSELLVIRDNNGFSHKRYRRMIQHKNSEEGQLQLSNMPPEDLFGPLQQGFEGERARYKRVKRDT